MDFISTLLRRALERVFFDVDVRSVFPRPTEARSPEANAGRVFAIARGGGSGASGEEEEDEDGEEVEPCAEGDEDGVQEAGG